MPGHVVTHTYPELSSIPTCARLGVNSWIKWIGAFSNVLWKADQAPPADRMLFSPAYAPPAV